MFSPFGLDSTAMQQAHGLIAILDALGAASYTDEEISRFLESRGRVLKLLKKKANELAHWEIDIVEDRVTTFTFNDTVLIVYRTENPTTSTDVKQFCSLLRKFVLDSLVHGILFRGSLSVGRFYVNDETNTVMGAAVTDAAAWYDAADWIGINATPHATLAIQALLEPRGDDLDALLVDYAVPLKDRAPTVLKAINWPKAFVVKGLTPCIDHENPRGKCLSLLTTHWVPKGTESKYFNSLRFYDYCIDLWRKQKKAK